MKPLSFSQYNRWRACAAAEAAHQAGEYEYPTSDAMLTGKVFDAVLTQPLTLDTMDGIRKKGGELYAWAALAVRAAMKCRDLFPLLLTAGEFQVPLEGEYGGVPFRGIADIVMPPGTMGPVGVVVDLKHTRMERAWNASEKRYEDWHEKYKPQVLSLIHI